MLRDIVQTSGRLKEKHADFVRDMERFREISDRREQTIRMLSSLLLAVELEQSAKLRLVDTICELALR